jgi:hypothetical protein
LEADSQNRWQGGRCRHEESACIVELREAFISKAAILDASLESILHIGDAGRTIMKQEVDAVVVSSSAVSHRLHSFVQSVHHGHRSQRHRTSVSFSIPSVNRFLSSTERKRHDCSGNPYSSCLPYSLVRPLDCSKLDGSVESMAQSVVNSISGPIGRWCIRGL